MSLVQPLVAETNSAPVTAEHRALADQQHGSTQATDEYTAVPAWFMPNASEPHAIFDAWRQLSTTKAVLTCGTGWHVMAGVLLDEQGRPRPNAMVALGYDDVIRGYGA